MTCQSLHLNVGDGIEKMRALFFLHCGAMPYSPLGLYTMCFFSICMELYKIVQAVNSLHKSRCGMRFWKLQVEVARES